MNSGERFEDSKMCKCADETAGERFEDLKMCKSADELPERDSKKLKVSNPDEKFSGISNMRYLITLEY